MEADHVSKTTETEAALAGFLTIWVQQSTTVMKDAHCTHLDPMKESYIAT